MKRETEAGGPREAAGITLRRVAPGDEEFVYRVYASTRAEELAPLGWSEAQQEAFLRMQFALRQKDYAGRLDPEGHHIILRRGEPVGAIWVSRDPREIRLADLAFLPSARGQGLGTILIRELLDESDRTGKPVRLMVWKTNEAAQRLYRRLGFEVEGDTPISFKMVRRPATFGFGKS